MIDPDPSLGIWTQTTRLGSDYRFGVRTTFAVVQGSLGDARVFLSGIQYDRNISAQKYRTYPNEPNTITTFAKIPNLQKFRFVR